MRRRGDRVTITSGKYVGRRGTIESNVYQKTVDYPDEWANGYHVMLDGEELVTVRWDQVEALGNGNGKESRLIKISCGNKPPNVYHIVCDISPSILMVSKNRNQGENYSHVQLRNHHDLQVQKLW